MQLTKNDEDFLTSNVKNIALTVNNIVTFEYTCNGHQIYIEYDGYVCNNGVPRSNVNVIKHHKIIDATRKSAHLNIHTNVNTAFKDDVPCKDTICLVEKWCTDNGIKLVAEYEVYSDDEDDDEDETDEDEGEEEEEDEGEEEEEDDAEAEEESK